MDVRFVKCNFERPLLKTSEFCKLSAIGILNVTLVHILLYIINKNLESKQPKILNTQVLQGKVGWEFCTEERCNMVIISRELDFNSEEVKKLDVGKITAKRL